MRIDLGCGPNKPAGWTGIDFRPLPGVDIVHNLGFGIPFEESSVDELRGRDFFEHMPDTIFIFNDCWRVLRPGGTLLVEVPRWPHVDAVKDPTHVHFFAVETFTEYLAGPDRLAGEYEMCLWNIVELKYDERRIWVTLTPRRP